MSWRRRITRLRKPGEFELTDVQLVELIHTPRPPVPLPGTPVPPPATD